MLIWKVKSGLINSSYTKHTNAYSVHKDYTILYPLHVLYIHFMYSDSLQVFVLPFDNTLMQERIRTISYIIKDNRTERHSWPDTCGKMQIIALKCRRVRDLTLIHYLCVSFDLNYLHFVFKYLVWPWNLHVHYTMWNEKKSRRKCLYLYQPHWPLPFSHKTHPDDIYMYMSLSSLNWFAELYFF